jgi:hypothetical protein
MKVILKRLWTDPVYLGTALVAAVGFGAALGLNADGVAVAAATTLISVLTGVEVKRRGVPEPEVRKRARRQNPSSE